ncbi:MAG: PAS domain S-box protein, partial [Acidobacteriaceae bacterium]|nr:PAS domain S-box protein [Acidobacteriaceae bacterium]
EAEILGQPGAVFFTPEDIAKGAVEQELEGANTTGRAEDERWHVRKDRSRFWGSGVMTSLRGPGGERRGYAKVMRDHTEQRLKSEALRLSEERFRLLVENVRDCALFSVDVQGNVTEWNAGGERIFGYSAEDILGRSAIDVLPADEEAKTIFRRDLEKAAKEGGAAAEAWLKRKHGTRFYARWTTNATRGAGGQLIGYTKVLRDETEHKETEQERERQFQRDRELLEGRVRFTNSALDRTKEELEDLAGQLLNVQDTERRTIARDLHDHLAQRIALIEIKIVQLRTGFRSNLDHLQSELGHIQVQVADLAEEVRNVAHRLHPSTLEHLGIVPALRSLVEELNIRRANQIYIDVENFFEEGLPPEIRSTLYRICEEALRNVQRHAGDVPVTVTLYRSPQIVHLEVQDEGPGFRQDALHSKKTLGLISMAERARLLGGTFILTSSPGHGAKLEVAVPVYEEAHKARGTHSGA